MKMLKKFNNKISTQFILISFWTIFWLLNGLDKFLNGKFFFGVTRDAQFIEYFSRLNLPDEIALACLYACGVSEVLLGSILFLSFLTRQIKEDLIQLSFKAGMSIFLIFSVFDILFGDRAELWEHSTFLILTLVSYGFWSADK